jgi:citrate lyase subunit beta / citryl-CoA lyase
MKLRSLLFVPGDSEKKFVRASASCADVLILDLEDAVAPSMKEAARGLVAGWIDQSDEVPAKLFVRINPLDTGLTEGDLAAVVRPAWQAFSPPRSMARRMLRRFPPCSTSWKRLRECRQGP